jgi:arginyl-tRNA synthetase
MTTRELLATRVAEALDKLFPNEDSRDPQLTAATRPEFGDYQSNAALSLAKKQKLNPLQLAQRIAEHTQVDDICEQAQVAPPGFVNFTLKKEFVAQLLQQMLAGNVVEILLFPLLKSFFRSAAFGYTAKREKGTRIG